MIQFLDQTVLLPGLKTNVRVTSQADDEASVIEFLKRFSLRHLGRKLFRDLLKFFSIEVRIQVDVRAEIFTGAPELSITRHSSRGRQHDSIKGLTQFGPGEQANRIPLNFSVPIVE